MNECLVIGRTNVGKTAFVLNFAEYLGLSRAEIYFRYPDGFSTKQSFRLDVARRELIGSGQHKTRCLQGLELEIPAGKVKKRIVMTDSSGFADGIPDDETVRKAVAQTLMQVRQASLVLHMLDAASPEAIGEVDRQVARFAETRGGYFILANKMDLPGAREGLERIRTIFGNHLVLAISATQKKGFKEVKAIVARSL
ncbi:MAG: GTPase domain-containing protein [Bacillota bacterium]|jgi:GTP-binding protein EngB required for normal cell division